MPTFHRLLTAAFLLALVSCGRQSTAPEQSASFPAGEIPGEVQARLDQYVIQDEDALASLAPGNFDPNDHLNDYDVYAVTYLWGAFMPVGSTPLVWDGKTWSNAVGAIRVVSDIDFEEGEEILFDSTLPGQFGWISSTARDLDGVSFLLFVKRGVVYIAPPMLTFETQPITFSIPVEELANHTSYHPVDQASGVAVFSRQIRNSPCPGGHLGGTWVFDLNTRAQGHFSGVWLSSNHEVAGVLSGRFWTDEQGHRLLSGQVSGTVTDQVIMELEGIWCLTPHLGISACPTCAGIGYFVGRWKYTDGSGVGKFAGHFGEPDLTAPTPELPFRGMWVQHCDEYAGDHTWSGVGK